MKKGLSYVIVFLVVGLLSGCFSRQIPEQPQISARTETAVLDEDENASDREADYESIQAGRSSTTAPEAIEQKTQAIETTNNETTEIEAEKEAAPTETVKTTQAPITTTSETKGAVSAGMSNALRAAKNYLKIMPFSYEGLIDQLMFDRFSNEEATYGADNCGADWFDESARCAKNYLDLMPFSREGLIDQLMFDGFSEDQAVYGAEKNGY